MNRVAMAAVAAVVLLSACDEKKAEAPPPNTATTGTTTSGTPATVDSGTAPGAQPSPAIGAAAGTTPVDGGAVTGATMTPGTDGGGAAAAGGAISAADRDQAKQIFAQRCVACHGSTGAGDGAAAAALNPKPRAFGDKVWQASVTDAHIEKIIEQGGAAVGKSPLMPPNPDLVGKPVVKGLREYVRSFGK